jgi:hypothetical protein
VYTKASDGGRRNFNVQRFIVAMKLDEVNVEETETLANDEANSKTDEHGNAC